MKHINLTNLTFKPSILAVLVAGTTVPAGAGEQKDLSDDETTQQPYIEVITVTAQKRSENIRDVPISIATFSADNIEKTGVRQLTEIAEFIPNLKISASNDFSSQITIRGVGAPNRNIGFDARVGVYLDGVYLGQSPVLNQELLALERIEVLRGPQGTLYGKNNVAGAINLISTKPGDEFAAAVGLEAGNYNSRQYTLTIDAPLTDNLLTKFSINQQTRDGLVKNIETGNFINEQDALSYRGQIRLMVSDDLEVNLSLDGLKSDRLSYDGQPITNTLGNALESFAPEKDEVSFNFDPFEERDISGEILTLDLALAKDYALKSITGHRDTEINYINDFDFSPEDIASLNYTDQYRQWSQEIQLISPEGDFQYIAGFYYYNQDAYTRRLPIVGDETISTFTGVPRSVFEHGASLGDPAAIFALAAFHPGTLSTIGDVETQSYSIFFNSDYQFSDAFKLGVGFRYSKEDKSVDWTVSSIDPATGIPVIPAFRLANGTVIDKRTDTDFSPLVSLSYQVAPTLNAFAKYSTGYKSGGYNVDFLTQAQLDAGIEFNKETVDSFDLGLKGDLLNQRLHFSATVFYSQYDDYQVQQLINLGAGTTAISIRNAAKVETKGAELELTYLASDNLELAAAVGLLDGEFVTFPAGGSNGEDLSGNSLPGVSDYSLNLSAQYYYPLPDLNADLIIRAGYNYQDDYNTSLDGETEITLANGNTLPVGAINGFGILNGRIGLSSINEDWSIYIWGRNLTDEDSVTHLGVKSFFGTRLNQYVTPRTYGLSIDYNF